MHLASADANESYSADIKASIQTYFLCQLAERPCFSEEKIHPPSNGKKIFFKKFSFINMIVIPEHRSMRLSLLAFLFLNSSVSHVSPMKGNAMSLGCWPPEDSWDPMTILAFFCFSLFLQNMLTKLQHREILSGAWGFVACATFSEVCTYTGVLVCRWVWWLAKPRVLCQPLVPTVSLVPAGTSMWPYNRDQESDSSWKLTQSSTGK